MEGGSCAPATLEPAAAVLVVTVTVTVTVVAPGAPGAADPAELPDAEVVEPIASESVAEEPVSLAVALGCTEPTNDAGTEVVCMFPMASWRLRRSAEEDSFAGSLETVDTGPSWALAVAVAVAPLPDIDNEPFVSTADVESDVRESFPGAHPSLPSSPSESPPEPPNADAAGDGASLSVPEAATVDSDCAAVELAELDAAVLVAIPSVTDSPIEGLATPSEADEVELLFADPSPVRPPVAPVA